MPLWCHLLTQRKIYPSHIRLSFPEDCLVLLIFYTKNGEDSIYLDLLTPNLPLLQYWYRHILLTSPFYLDQRRSLEQNLIALRESGKDQARKLTEWTWMMIVWVEEIQWSFVVILQCSLLNFSCKPRRKGKAHVKTEPLLHGPFWQALVSHERFLMKGVSWSIFQWINPLVRSGVFLVAIAKKERNYVAKQMFSCFSPVCSENLEDRFLDHQSMTRNFLGSSRFKRDRPKNFFPFGLCIWSNWILRMRLS